jgi:hypothetical protein
MVTNYRQINYVLACRKSAASVLRMIDINELYLNLVQESAHCK